MQLVLYMILYAVYAYSDSECFLKDPNYIPLLQFALWMIRDEHGASMNPLPLSNLYQTFGLSSVGVGVPKL